LQQLKRVVGFVLGLIIVPLILAGALGCSTGAAPEGREALTVFAAASLTEAFAEVAGAFEKAHPGVSVDLNFAGSQRLRVQLEHGARADVFASADERQMDLARASGLLGGEAVDFAGNRLVFIVSMPATGDPKEQDDRSPSPGASGAGPPAIGSIDGLARKGLKLVLAHPEVPAGGYARAVIQNMSEDPRFGPDYARRLLDNVVSEELNVRSVLQKVVLGEADAGIVYFSDTLGVSNIDVIPVPEEANVVARYPMAILRGSVRPETARAFVQFVTSAEGRAILRDHGFGPPPAAPQSRWDRSVPFESGSGATGPTILTSGPPGRPS
jgi:molybdate transport system substrate-binding protein